MSKRLTDQDKDSMNSKIFSLLYKRTQMAKFPFNTTDELYEFWRTVTPSTLVRALDILDNDDTMRGLLGGEYHTTYRVGDYIIGVHSGSKLWETPKGGLVISDNNQQYEALLEFATLRFKSDHETAITNNVARHLIYCANAAGQIKRAWPELASFLNGEAAESLKSVQRASRLPPGFDMEPLTSNIDMFNRVIAEAHILPEPKHEELSFTVEKVET